MTIEIWLAFFMASLLLCFIPGPTVFLVVGKSLLNGKKSVVPIVAGVLSGDIIAMLLSFIGLGAILAISASLFTILKLLGAGYLIYLGVSGLINSNKKTMMNTVDASAKSSYWQATLVTAFNPKGIMFFMAFFPLFINQQTPIFEQMMILSFTFLIASAISSAFYSILSQQLGQKLRNPNWQKKLGQLGSIVLISAGAFTATMDANQSH